MNFIIILIIISYVLTLGCCAFIIYQAERNKNYKYLMESKYTFLIMLSILLAFAPISIFIIIYSILKEVIDK